MKIEQWEYEVETKFICTGLVRKEIEGREKEDFVTLGIDSDHELDSSDDEDAYHSESEANYRKTVDYDLDKMFEIIRRRDSNKWSINTLQHRYHKLSANPSTFRSQLTR